MYYNIGYTNMTRRKIIMEISSLQKARYEYAPKLPQMLRGGISEISVSEGAETGLQSPSHAWCATHEGLHGL